MNLKPSALGGFAPLRDQQIDLAVVDVDARMLERVEHGLLDVVQVAPSPVGRKGIHAQGDATSSRRLAGTTTAQEGTDVLAERPALPADQRARPDPPPVVVDRGWIRKCYDHGQSPYRFHGGVLSATGACCG